MNLLMILYLAVNQVDSCHSCEYDPSTRDTKDILWIDFCVLILTYESIVSGFIKHHILDMT